MFGFGFLGWFCFKYMAGSVPPERPSLMRKVTKLRELKKKVKAKAIGPSQNL